VRLLLALGGNLQDPPAAFRMALGALAARHPVVAVSRLYRTRPVGPPQPRFWNLVALLEPDAPLLDLLGQCQELELAAGRERAREARWGPRPLDLDLLAAEGVVHRGPRLELPHPRFGGRAFVLVPAAELAPEWRLAGSGPTLAALAAALAPGNDVEPYGPFEL
jgi:2-amino-4-hydroxy-6-hydroxymethyldihydropteridine diphosphokinase